LFVTTFEVFQLNGLACTDNH